MNWKILVADPIADEGIAALTSEATVDVRLGLKPDELASVIGDYDALVVRSETRVPAEVIEA
ncbi:MAG: phosphoglycerate dehydrogenase, partial [Dehalococcoidia bacterium]